MKIKMFLISVLLIPTSLYATDNSELLNRYNESEDGQEYLRALTHEDCISLVNEIGRSSSLWKICTDFDTERHDKKLNDSYKILIKENRGLRDIQRAWIKYRDLKCNFRMTSGASGMGTYACMREETKRRSEELLGLIEFRGY